MKRKVKELVNAREPLERLCEVKGLSSMTAFSLARNKRAMADDLEAYDKASKKIIDQYAVKDENGLPQVTEGKGYIFKLEDLAAVNGEFGDLLEAETDINIRRVNLEDLDKAGISANDILNLEFMLDLDEENKKEGAAN